MRSSIKSLGTQELAEREREKEEVREQRKAKRPEYAVELVN
jgi:hypothetical protein